MTRRFILSLAMATVTAATSLPVTAVADRSQQLVLDKTIGPSAPGGLKGTGGSSEPQAVVYETYEDKLLADCNAGNGGMITDETGNYDCVDSEGNSLWD